MRALEVIPFQAFMRGQKTSCKEVKLHSVTFSPLMLIDPTMVTIGGVVLGVVAVEKLLVIAGYENIAEYISTTLKATIPFVIIGAFVFFLATNPILSWL